MSPDNSAPIGASYPSDLFVGLLAEVQLGIVRVSIASRGHLAELERIPGKGRHGQEAHRLAIGLTARDLKAATEALDAAFAALREESRGFARIISSQENCANQK